MSAPSYRPSWGPRPVYAMLPFCAAFAAGGWAWSQHPADPLASPPVAVTAMKPVDGASPTERRLPAEIVYGVPTEGTLHLWLARR